MKLLCKEATRHQDDDDVHNNNKTGKICGKKAQNKTWLTYHQSHLLNEKFQSGQV